MTQHLIIDHKDTRLELEGLALKIHRPDRKPSRPCPALKGIKTVH